MITLRKRRPSDSLTAQCHATDSVGDLVRLVSVVPGELPLVERINPYDVSKMPVYGILIEKFSNTTCVVQVSGAVDLPAGTLQAGKVCFAGADGRPSPTPPRAADGSTGTAVVQVVGLATGSASLQISPAYTVISSVA